MERGKTGVFTGSFKEPGRILRADDVLVVPRPGMFGSVRRASTVHQEKKKKKKTHAEVSGKESLDKMCGYVTHKGVGGDWRS